MYSRKEDVALVSASKMVARGVPRARDFAAAAFLLIVAVGGLYAMISSGMPGWIEAIIGAPLLFYLPLVIFLYRPRALAVLNRVYCGYLIALGVYIAFVSATALWLASRTGVLRVARGLGDPGFMVNAVSAPLLFWVSVGGAGVALFVCVGMLRLYFVRRSTKS